MKLILDRAFVTEFLSSTAFSRVRAPIAGLRVLKDLGDPVTILFDVTHVSAFASKMREIVDPDILIEFLHKVKVRKSLDEGLRPWVERLTKDDSVSAFANGYALDKGGVSVSIEAEIRYCIWLIAMAHSANSSLLISFKRKNLVRSVLQGLEFRSIRTSEHGPLHVEAFSSTQKKLWRRSEICVLWFDNPASDHAGSMPPQREDSVGAKNDVRILFLAANPQATTALDLEGEISSIQEQLRAIKYRDTIQFKAQLAVKPDDLIRTVREFRPTIVHFSGHGAPDGIVLRNDAGGYNIVSAAALKRFFTGRGVQGVVFNACYSEAQALAIRSAVNVVVGTTKALQDEAALRFSVAFYRTIGDGHNVGEAFRDGGDAVALHALEDCFVLYGDREHKFL
jgi:hypothetical protein